jgi:hypothetical protein
VQAKCPRVRPPFIVDGGGDIPSPSLNVGEVDHYRPLCIERVLAVVQFGQLGFDGRSLTDELTPLLCGPMLSVTLLNVGSHLLLLLISP